MVGAGEKHMPFGIAASRECVCAMSRERRAGKRRRGRGNVEAGVFYKELQREVCVCIVWSAHVCA